MEHHQERGTLVRSSKLLDVIRDNLVGPAPSSEIGQRKKSVFKILLEEKASKKIESNLTSDIMMLLDTEKVNSLRKEFEKAEDGLPLHQFVAVMKTFLKGEDDVDEREVVASLCELFAQIDINGDGNMEWGEFTSFIVETGMAVEAHEPNSIRMYYRSKWEDNIKHHAILEKLYFWQPIDRIGSVEVDSNILNLYNHKLEPMKPVHVSAASGSILCADYIPKLNQYAISTSNLEMGFYDESNCRLVKKFPTPSSQLCMTYQDSSLALSSPVLFSAGISGVIHAWNTENCSLLFNMGGAGPNGKFSKYSHEDMVLDLLKISSLECLASGGMDRSIRLWDINTGKPRKVLEGHAKGVTSLAYSKEYRFLVSAGFDYDAIVWNPYVETLILRLHGHTSSLVGVEIIPNTPQIITADQEGFFKVWDIRNFSCMQTFSSENAASIRAFCAIYDHKSLVSAGRGFTVFDYEKLENPDLTDDIPIFAAIYNPTSNTFITAAGSMIKVWDAKNGKLSRVYRGLSGTDITSICLDDRERKFIIGDHDGEVKVFDYLNGALMKSFEYPPDNKAHISEVTRLVYANQHKCVVSASWDKTICIHDEMDPDKGILLRKMYGGHSSDITALAYSENLSLIASSDSDGILNIWDYEFARLEDSCIGHSSGITALTFLDPFPGLLAADNNGNIVLWGMRPTLKKYKCLFQFTNTNLFNRNLASPVICMATHCKWSADCTCAESNGVCKGVCDRYVISYDLFTGDEKGEIKHWNLLNALQTLKITSKFVPILEPFPCSFPRRNLHRNATDYVENLKQSSEYSKLKQSARSLPFYFQDGTPIVSNMELKLVKTWRGHSDTINSIQCIKDPPSLLTASFDRLVKVWSMGGEFLGSLRQGEHFSGKDWKFKIDLESKADKRMRNAKNVIEEIEKENDDDDDDDDENKDDDDDEEDEDDKGRVFNTKETVIDDFSFDDGEVLRKTPKLRPVNSILAGKGFSSNPQRIKMRLRK